MRSVVLSPHLDDAVLSCWHVLEGAGDVGVVNVFSGSPPAGTPAPAWDRLTGGEDPARRVGERRAEDARALARAGRRAVALGLLDEQYRREQEVSVAGLVQRLTLLLGPRTAVHAPAALSGHRDHALVRDAALALARDGRPVVLYADLPHGIARGWPGWVTGVPAAGPTDVAAAWDGTLRSAGLHVSRLVACVRPLDAQARARKLRALAEYRTQRAALDGLSFVPLADPQALAFEVSWRVPSSALRRADEAGGQPVVPGGGGQALHDGR